MAKVQWLLIGIVGIAIAVVTKETLLSFINLPSFVITVGGTLAATSFSYSWDTLKGLGAVVHAVLTSKFVSPEKHLAQLVQLAQLNHLEGLRALEHREASLQDPFLRRAISMIVDMRREEEVREVIEREFFLFTNRYEASRQVLLTMGKLFPSFGMVGTLIGLVLLLRQATNPDPQALIPALAVAVLTTLYGAVFANALVLPLAAKLQAFIQDRELTLRLTVEGVTLIARGQPPAVVQKRLTPLLTHGEMFSSSQHLTPSDQRGIAFSPR